MQSLKQLIAVSYSDPSLVSHAQELAQKLNLALVDLEQGFGEYEHLLVQTLKHLEVRYYDSQALGSFFIDFNSEELRRRCAKAKPQNEAIAKAIGIKPQQQLTVIDATAGIGRDSLILSILGCNVTMLERSKILFALLQDALDRFYGDVNLNLLNVDSCDYLQQLASADFPDVIYLDPMYPETKKSAKVKKEMQYLQLLIGKDQGSDKLLAKALQAAKKRVVVKRPKSVKPLAGQEPAWKIQSKQHRFDVYPI